MSRRALAVFVTVLLTSLGGGGCGCRDEVEPPAQTAPEPDVVAAGAEADNLTFAATDDDAAVTPEEPALPPALAVEPHDFSATPGEVEPNDEVDQASAMTKEGEQWVARGRLAERDFDWYQFTVEGEPQLWLIEAVGPQVERLRYQNAAGEQKQGALQEGSSQWTIAGLFLTPGHHWLEVWGRGEDAEYTLRAVPLGAPDRWVEREPNDEMSRAHLLRFGTPRSGWLFEEGDEDYYQFSLNADDYVELELAAPPEVTPRLMLIEMGLTSSERTVVRYSGREAGERLTYRARLPSGDYIVEIKAEKGRSPSPYRLRVHRLDPFDLPADLEPNDQPRDACPLPASLVAVGTVGDAGDEDWYRLPVLKGETVVRAEVLNRPEGSGTHYFLRLYREDEDGHAKQFAWDEERSLYEGTIDGTTPWLARVYGDGAYEVHFAFDPGPAARSAAGSLPVRLSLPTGPIVFAAYLDQDQQAQLPITLVSESDRVERLLLDVETSHHAWRARPERTEVVLEPGRQASVGLTLSVAQDAWAERPVRVTVRTRDQDGAQRTASIDAVARCGAPPLGARLPQPLPPELLGGLNVAWSALGARPVAADEAAAEDQAPLHDGLTPNDDDWYTRQTPRAVTVELAGAEPVPVTGFLLNPRGRNAVRHQVRDFELALSLDGEQFTTLITDELSRSPREQPFVLATPQPARFARLTVLSSQEEVGGYTALGEWMVLAQPGRALAGVEPFNLAHPRFGGHVVWSDPLMASYDLEAVLTEEIERPRLRFDALNPNRWVIGFHNQRAAQITTLEWVQADDYYRAGRLSTVLVAVSTESPVGPWTPLGTWTLETTPGSTSRLEFPTPVWARYVRFSTTEPTDSSQWHLPETLRILERVTGEGYRSVLGEWGQYARWAFYESVVAARQAADRVVEASDNDSRSTAQTLEPGRQQRGEVLVGEDVDWYRLEVPRGHNRLELTLAGDPALRVVGRIEDAQGQALSLDGLAEITAEGWRADLAVAGGDVYFVQVEEPPRSIALVWDTSSSTNAFKSTLYQALPRFVASVQSEREFVNLLPFQSGGGAFLLEEWSDQPYALQSVLNDYDRDDGSSEAELALLTATRELARRSGTRAVVFLTDAETHSYDKTAELWQLLQEVRPRVFTLELHRGDVSRHQDLMQSWAATNEGRYDFFRSNADLEVAFDRASCHLRRPAGYFLTAKTRFEEPPGPGTLRVLAPESAIGRPAVELILDASGSMLQRLEGRRRIEIAREVLVSLVEETLPPGTPLALRVFGHKTPGACQTDLEVPLTPLRPDEVVPVIRRTEAKNLAKTPIGASLELVAADLADATGPKIVILVTDGEETCEGDPQASINGLKEKGIDVRISIVGFAIEEEALKETFRRWANLGGGLYFDATSGEELGRAMRQALQPKFQVLDADGEVVASGVTNGDAIEVPAGLYSVRVLTSPLRLVEQVRIQGEDEVVVELEPLGPRQSGPTD